MRLLDGGIKTAQAASQGLTARVLERVLGLGICVRVRLFSRELGGTVKRDQWRGALMNVRCQWIRRVDVP